MTSAAAIAWIEGTKGEEEEEEDASSHLPLLSSPPTVRNEKNDLRLEQRWNRGVRDERAARCVYLSCLHRHSNPAPPPFSSSSSSSSSSRFSSLVPSKFILVRVPPTGPFLLPFSSSVFIDREGRGEEGDWLALLRTGFFFGLSSSSTSL